MKGGDLMKKPLGAVRIPLEKLSKSELKVYLKVLENKENWNSSLRYFISIGEIVVDEEIEVVKNLLI